MCSESDSGDVWKCFPFNESQRKANCTHCSMTNLLEDVRYALRGLRKSPLFTIVALASLAIGIGANTAVFSLMDQALLRSLPVKHPEELVLFKSPGPRSGTVNSNYERHGDVFLSDVPGVPRRQYGFQRRDRQVPDQLQLELARSDRASFGRPGFRQFFRGLGRACRDRQNVYRRG